MRITRGSASMETETDATCVENGLDDRERGRKRKRASRFAANSHARVQKSDLETISFERNLMRRTDNRSMIPFVESKVHFTRLSVARGIFLRYRTLNM